MFISCWLSFGALTELAAVFSDRLQMTHPVNRFNINFRTPRVSQDICVQEAKRVPNGRVIPPTQFGTGMCRVFCKTGFVFSRNCMALSNIPQGSRGSLTRLTKGYKKCSSNAAFWGAKIHHQPPTRIPCERNDHHEVAKQHPC